MIVKTDSIKNNRAEASAEWTSEKGIAIGVSHISSENRELAQAKMTFARQYEGVDCEYTISMSSIDGSYSSYLTFYFDDKKKKKSFVRVFVTGEYQTKVEIESADPGRIEELFNNSVPLKQGFNLQSITNDAENRIDFSRGIVDEIFLGNA